MLLLLVMDDPTSVVTVTPSSNRQLPAKVWLPLFTFKVPSPVLRTVPVPLRKLPNDTAPPAAVGANWSVPAVVMEP